jgi:uncharacterized membrane protein YphA (DoxX/SURF4 family)
VAVNDGVVGPAAADGREPPAAVAGDDVLDHAWRTQRVWSTAANDCKRRIDRARDAALVLAVVGAVLGVLATQLESLELTPVLAIVAGSAVGMVPLVRRSASQKAVTDWTRARSVSEGIKSEVYAYLGGGSAYAGPDRSRLLLDRTREIVASAGDLVSVTAGLEPDDRPVPDIQGINDYIEHRLRDQTDAYYRPKAKLYARRLARMQRIQAILGGVAVVLGVAVATGQLAVVGAWVAVVSTVSATVAAHAGAARYDHQVLEFQRTVTQLEHLLAGWRLEGMGPAELIDACEEVISVENQAWMARMVHDDLPADSDDKP